MRVLLADNQPHVRVAIHFLLDQQPNVHLIGAADTCDLLLEQSRTLRPDLILVNWELWRLCCAELCASLRARPQAPKLIVFSSRFEVRQAALNSGADTFFCVYDPPETFIHLVQKAMVHQPHGAQHQ